MGTDPHPSCMSPLVLCYTELIIQKACDAFDKKASLKPAQKWLSVYAPRIRKRLSSHLPHIASDLTDQDILAMHMVSSAQS
jgi:hypothetical protein